MPAKKFKKLRIGLIGAGGIAGTHLYNYAQIQPTRAPGEHGLMVQKMLDGIYASAEKGRQVRIS